MWILVELCGTDFTAYVDSGHVLQRLPDCCLESSAVGRGGLLLSTVGGASPDAAAPLDQKPFLVSQHCRQSLNPFHDLDVIVADVAGITQESRGRQSDDRYNWVHTRNE